MSYQIIAQPSDVIGQFVGLLTHGSEPWGNFSALGLVRDNMLIAGTIYNHFVSRPGGYQSCCMHVAAIKGKRWLIRDYLHACFDYPFNQLGCVRVTGLVPRKNKQARKFDEHLGFVLEATLKKQIPGDDMLVYRMYKSDCKWLKTIPEPQEIAA